MAIVTCKVESLKYAPANAREMILRQAGFLSAPSPALAVYHAEYLVKAAPRVDTWDPADITVTERNPGQHAGKRRNSRGAIRYG